MLKRIREVVIGLPALVVYARSRVGEPVQSP
jgi:hypothetical protein